MNNKKIKVILFDLDDTLWDTYGFTKRARENAIKEMIKHGLNVSFDKAMEELNKIIKEKGSNYNKHFNLLCKRFNIKNELLPKIVAAGVVGYHQVKNTMHTLPNVEETLIELLKREYKLGLITYGIKIKQWEKILRLKLIYFFDYISVSSKPNKEKEIKKALKFFKVKPNEVVFVGDNIKSDIISANKVGLITIRILTGKYSNIKPQSKEETPNYEIKDIKELLNILDNLEKKN